MIQKKVIDMNNFSKKIGDVDKKIPDVNSLVEPTILNTQLS